MCEYIQEATLFESVEPCLLNFKMFYGGIKIYNTPAYKNVICCKISL